MHGEGIGMKVAPFADELIAGPQQQPPPSSSSSPFSEDAPSPQERAQVAVPVSGDVHSNSQKEDSLGAAPPREEMSGRN